MQLNDLQFPLEANVQTLAHFTDTRGTYAFTFGSPYCYTSPEELKTKEAFLLGAFNQQKKKSLTAEAVYTYYINSPDKIPHPDPSVKASVRESMIYRADGTVLGSINILLQRGMFRSYKGLNLNPVYDADKKLVGFCHFSSQNKSKDIFRCNPDFQLSATPVKDEEIQSLEAAGKIHRVFSYDIVDSEEADNKDRFMAIFSSSKKSELTNNRIRYFGCEDDEDLKDLLLTALFAFFWGTYIDIPLS